MASQPVVSRTMPRLWNRTPSPRYRVALQQTALGDYRQELLETLQLRWGADFHVYTGREYFSGGARVTTHLPGALTVVDNHFMLGRRFNWQSGVLGPLSRADVAIVELNPRVLSVWVILLWRRMSRRRTVLWGHAWSRGGPDAPAEPIRRLMRRLADVVLVYSHAEQAELALRTPNVCVEIAPNAVYRRANISVVRATPKATDILVSGRLLAAKKPQLILAAFIEASSDLAPNMRLVFAGDGPELSALEAMARASCVSDRIVFLGHVPTNSMRQHYARALVTASPGYVGLALIQSISHGLPMIIARDEPHAPEIDAAVDGVNAILVPSDDVGAWARALVDVDRDRDLWGSRRPEIAADCLRRFSFEAMADGFARAVSG